MNASILIACKPMSVNTAWQGKRFKTKGYKKYERDVLLLLPKITVPDCKLSLILTFGFSNAASDWDNPIKPFVDILQKKYGFDDKMIYRSTVHKQIVKKGGEFIMFKFDKFEG